MIDKELARGQQGMGKGLVGDWLGAATGKGLVGDGLLAGKM